MKIKIKNIQQFTKHKYMRIDSKYWVKALRGDKTSLDYILDHNIKDVIDLEKVFNKLINFGKFTNKSI